MRTPVKANRAGNDIAAGTAPGIATAAAGAIDAPVAARVVRAC
jgi:hypothetical protein